MGNGDEESLPLVEDSCLVHVISRDDVPPEFIVYRGKKYFSEMLLTQRNETIEDLKGKTKELTSRVNETQTTQNKFLL
jgi:hypothetical protein